MNKKHKLIDVLVEVHETSKIPEFKTEIEKIAIETLFSNDSMIEMRISRLKSTFEKYYPDTSSRNIISLMMKNYISKELDVEWEEKED